MTRLQRKFTRPHKKKPMSKLHFKLIFVLNQRQNLLGMHRILILLDLRPADTEYPAGCMTKHLNVL
jgi:hypothetical protein